MSIAELNSAIELVHTRAQADFHGPQPNELVERAEGVLGLEFPPTYREFLKQLGAGHVKGCEIYGITHGDFENSGIPNAIWLTLKRRRTVAAPRSLIFVGDAGDGGYYVIDVARKSVDEENPVVLWWPDQPLESCEIVANDFGSFLLEQVQWSIEEWPK